MSGLEILGVGASAIQVAQVTLNVVTSLTVLVNQILDAPKLLQTRLVQVKTLIEISRLIASMPQLQTAEVEAILRGCSRDARELKDVLQGLVTENGGSSIKKWTKAVGGVVMEKRIIGLLHNLEVGKSSLTLCITRIDSTLLYDIDSRLEVMRRDLEDVAQNVKAELPRLRTAIQALSEQYQDSESKVSSKLDKTDACLMSLSAMDQKSFISQMLNRSKRSGDWVLRNPKYVSFLESTKPDLLWLTAPAGCGKTTLASHIIQNLQVNQASQASAPHVPGMNSIVLFFFFHKSNMSAEGTAIGAFRTIVWQLACQAPETLYILLERYELLSSRGNFDWSCENLLGIIGDMIERILPNSRLYIVLDALDECEAESREWLMDWLKERLDDSEASQTSKLTKALLKVVVTSRPDGSIFDSLSHFSTLEMTISDTVSDMHNLIETRIGDFARRRHLDKDVKESITQFLEENAHGMFLWVVLVIQELERRDERLTDEVIKAKLSSIPLTLINTYEALLGQPSPARRKDMWRIIRWLLFGKRGLTLAELEMALCLETGVSRWYDFAGDINALCGSLVRFDGPRGEISLVHQTARDFLETFTSTTASENVSGLEMSTFAANTHLAEICIEYLSNNDDFTGIQYYRGFPSGSAVGLTLARNPFLYYAAENWASHVRAVGKPDPKLSGLVIALLESEQQRNRLMQLIYHINYRADHCFPRSKHPLHLAAYFNLPWLVDFYISQDPSAVHSENLTNDTPLIWAAEMGSTECVRKLLEAGADPNRVEIDGWSPLHWAVRNGHRQVARLLLEYSARVDRKDRIYEQGIPIERPRWSSRRKTWAFAKILDQWGLQETIQS